MSSQTNRISALAFLNNASDRRLFTFVALLAAALGGAFGLLIWTESGMQPAWVYAGVLLLVVIAFGIIKYPAIVIALVLIVPRVKDRPALRFIQDRADLTVIALTLLIVAILLHYIASLSRPRTETAKSSVGSTIVLVAFGLFATIVAASYLYTPAPVTGWMKLTRFLLIDGLVFIAPFFLIKEEKDFRSFVIAMSCGAIVLVLMTVGIILEGKPGLADDIERLGPAEDIGMCLLFLLYYKIFRARHLQIILIAVGVPCLVMGQLLTASRGPIVGVFLAVTVASFAIGKTRFRLRSIATGLAVLTLIVGMGVVALQEVPLPHELAWKSQAKWSELVKIFRGDKTRGSATKRIVLYEAALRTISKKPVFGLGVGGWNVYYRGQDVFFARGIQIADYPHDLVLEVAAEEGVLGVLALVLFLISVTRLVMRTVTTHPVFIVLLPLFVFGVTCALFSGDIERNRLLWLWCGMPVAVSRIQPSPQL